MRKLFGQIRACWMLSLPVVYCYGKYVGLIWPGFVFSMLETVWFNRVFGLELWSLNGGMTSMCSHFVECSLQIFHLTVPAVLAVSVTQSCLTLCDPMDCSPPGSSVHGIFKARIPEWVSIPFSRGSSPPRDWTQVSCTAGRLFTVWDTRSLSTLQRRP